MVNGLKIVWTQPALNQLKNIYDYISIDSVQNAMKVIRDITDEVEKLAHHPLKHRTDQYKVDNDGTYLAFEKHHYRISYREEHQIIRILRIRHTKMNPKKY